MSVADTSLPLAAAISVAAGAISFASPCVLPLVPGYLAFISGLAGGEASASGQPRPAGSTPTSKSAGAGAVAVMSPPRRIVVPGALLFVGGFACFFTVIGGAFGGVGSALAAHRSLLQQAGGALVTLMGLFMLGLWRPAALEGDTRALAAVRVNGLRAAFPLGVVFAAGWTPCLGPTLATILTLSASGPHSDPGRGAFLALAYALGLGLPFIAVAASLSRGLRAVAVLRRHTRAIERAGGALLVTLGLLLVTGLYGDLLAALRPFLAQVTTPI